jgi:putative FmdB family regulatory protein
MPIYAYKCGSCGHAKDVLQKISDAPLTTCPACGAEAFGKQLTAPGFQLKGSGWYVTDFRNNASSTSSTKADAKSDSKPADSSSGDSKPAEGGSSTSKSDTPSASAGGCGSACACH